jgi:hypothetical protein
LTRRGERRAIRRLVEIALAAEAHQQHAVGGDLRHVVQQQRAAELALEVAAPQHVAQVVARGDVDALRRGGELAALEHPNHHATRALLLGAAALYAKFH